jgi:hypothetical protein
MANPVAAQLGSDWVEYSPPRKVHLAEKTPASRTALRTFDWAPKVEIGTPTPCATCYEAV